MEHNLKKTLTEMMTKVNSIEDQGTRIVIYNLWEDDQGELELDFCADRHDIQLGGVNRDEKKIQMAAQFPNSRHFLTYQHSLRSYAAILYLRLPHYFRIILRGKDVQHHNIVNDMMLAQEITYRPQVSGNAFPKDANMVAVVNIGFVKDAKNHIDIQGFNVYHKNRLIKPFWRLWNAAGSDGRGVIGVLEANFVEPAHDKQGFERTLVLQRLESKLVQIQKQYWFVLNLSPELGSSLHPWAYSLSPELGSSLHPWAYSLSPELGSSLHPWAYSLSPELGSTNCHKIGYAPRRNKKLLDGYSAKDNHLSIQSQDSRLGLDADHSCLSYKGSNKKSANGLLFSSPTRNATSKFGKKIGVSPPSRVRGKSPSEDDGSESDIPSHSHNQTPNDFGICNASAKRTGSSSAPQTSSSSFENIESEQQHAAKRGMNNVVTGVKIHEFEKKLEEANKEQEALIDIFSEERSRRDREEEMLKRKFKDDLESLVWVATLTWSIVSFVVSSYKWMVFFSGRRLARPSETCLTSQRQHVLFCPMTVIVKASDAGMADYCLLLLALAL
ncbi:hypothetical protein ACLOJK_002169 [Asimina triloba]